MPTSDHLNPQSCDGNALRGGPCEGCALPCVLYGMRVAVDHDDFASAASLAADLRQLGFDARSVRSTAPCWEFDLVLAGWDVALDDALDWLGALRTERPWVPALLLRRDMDEGASAQGKSDDAPVGLIGWAAAPVALLQGLARLGCRAARRAASAVSLPGPAALPA